MELEATISDQVSDQIQTEERTPTSSDQDHNKGKDQTLGQEGLKDTMSREYDQSMVGLTSETLGIEQSECKQSLPGAAIKTGCDGDEKFEDAKDDVVENAPGEATDDVFSARESERGSTIDNDDSGLAFLPSSSSHTSTTMKNSDCTSHADASNNNLTSNNDSENNNNNNNNINNNGNGDNNDSAFCGNFRRGHPINKILSPLMSSSTSSSSSSTPPSFFPASVHRTSSSLSSISEAEMLTMMETMGESEILSALPPCDCDECLLNGPNSPTIVPPDQRKLTRVSWFRFDSLSME
ncbi:hypothetical protein EGW08_018648 [Elysia chlorotica]|uniref:Uncharacterized protein n=1 Tax=Elysia chlorotica TaxID=188477 RepID=A0A3S0Z961_ELYCH|nr:hypothetical protein EGW08_018648 [Elysia chlorotica]